MSTIPSNETTRRLLYTPYSKDRNIDAIIKERMTEEEFHINCFVHADIGDERIKSIRQRIRQHVDECEDINDKYKREYIIAREIADEIAQVKVMNDAYEAFRDWIKNNGNGVYCIKGDAGTGKSIFLHRLRYSQEFKNTEWHIIDLEESINPVRVISKKVIFDESKFDTLVYKVISAMLVSIFKVYIIEDKDISITIDNLTNIYLGYLEGTILHFQIEEVRLFFDSLAFLDNPAHSSDANLESHITHLVEHINKIVKDKNPKEVIDILLDVYMTLLRTIEPNKKHIIAFDNIERFIDIAEISNYQLDDFIEQMRHITDSYYSRDELFFERFQFLVLMRKTSSRMQFWHAQSAEYGGHDLDLTGWFPADQVIANKLKWYEKEKIEIEDKKYIDMIIGNNPIDGYTIRSLQYKLEKLFNGNKRLVTFMLAEAISLSKQTNPAIMERFTAIVDNNAIKPSLRKFAARSIIMRLIIDVMKRDRFFYEIYTQEDSVRKIRRLSYSRRLLCILDDYRLNHPEDEYMPFTKFISRLIGPNYLDDNCKYKRELIANILYSMNYYNRSEMSTLHLIDIQYFIGRETVRIRNPQDLYTVVFDNCDSVKLRIMDSGIAYLKYIVQSFEYYSSRYVKEDELLPPLLSAIPTSEEISKVDLDCISAYRIISLVKTDAIECIEYMKERTKYDINYRKNRDDRKGKPHIQRVIDAHTGYIENFIDVLLDVYSIEGLDDRIKNKLNQFIDMLHAVVVEYRSFNN